MTAAARPILLPYQQRWVADDAEVKLCEKGRRIGLTWAGGLRRRADRRAQRRGGRLIRLLHRLQPGHGARVRRRLWHLGAPFGQAAGEADEFLFDDTDEHGDSRQIKAFRIDFASAHSIVALSSRPRSLRGMQGVVVIDEAAFHDDLAGLMKAALALLIWGGKLRVISTHNGDENPFNELVAEVRAGRKPLRAAPHRLRRRAGRWPLPPHRGGPRPGLVGRRPGRLAPAHRRVLPPERGRENCSACRRWAAGSICPRALIEGCMAPAPVIRWRAPNSFAELPAHIREADIRDWCEAELAALLAALPGDLRTPFRPGLRPHRRPDRGPAAGHRARPGPAVPLRGRAVEHAVRATAPGGCSTSSTGCRGSPADAWTPAATAPTWPRWRGSATARRWSSGLNFTVEWYRENMPRYKAGLEDRMIELPRDSEILDDRRQIVMVNGVARVPDTGRVKTADGRQRHGDAAIAGALAYIASLTDSAPIAFLASGRDRRRRARVRRRAGRPPPGGH